MKAMVSTGEGVPVLNQPVRPSNRTAQRRTAVGGLFASPARAAGLLTAFAGFAVTLLFAVVPRLDFAYRRPPLRAGLETSEALVALLVAYLVVGRLARTRKIGDIIMAVALGAIAGAHIVFGLLPTLFGNGSVGAITGWAGLSARVVGAILFAVAAVVPERSIPRRIPPARATIVLSVVLLTVLTATATALHLAAPDVPSGRAVPVSHLDLGHGYGVLIQIVTMVAFTIAAIGFAGAADRRPDDELLPWFGAAAVFGSYAALRSAISPAAFYTDWVYPADVLVLLFYVMLLVGAAREIKGYWHRLAMAAASEERRRLARDLHDGLAQEVAYMTRAAKELRGGFDDELVVRMEESAQRALRESRQVIAALTSPTEPLSGVLERLAHDAAARYGVETSVDVASGPRLDAARTEALVRIMGEAVANAARHSGAPSIDVRLGWRGSRPWLQVSDHGVGFDPTLAGRGGGFGLTSMRERAAAVGAQLRLRTAPGAGTTLEVRF